MSDEQRISLEDLPAYIESLLAKEEQLQGQIRLRSSDLEKALATIAILTAERDALRDILKRLRSHILPDAGQEGEDLLRMDLNDVDDLLATQHKEQDDD